MWLLRGEWAYDTGIITDTEKATQLAFCLNLYRTVIGLTEFLSGQWRSSIDLSWIGSRIFSFAPIYYYYIVDFMYFESALHFHIVLFALTAICGSTEKAVVLSWTLLFASAKILHRILVHLSYRYRYCSMQGVQTFVHWVPPHCWSEVKVMVLEFSC